MHPHKIHRCYRILFTLLSCLCLLPLAGCNLLINFPGSTAQPSPSTSPTQLASPSMPQAAVTFQVSLPAPLPAGEALNLSVVDEVTGLALNPVNTPMQSVDDTHYHLTLLLPLNSLVKYRYSRQSQIYLLEDTPADKPVRYRMLLVSAGAVVQDVVASWSGTPFSGPTGRLTGKVLDARTNKPLPDVLLDAGGQQTLSDSNGIYNFETLPPGVHNLVSITPDGSYLPFQQGAQVQADTTTQANFSLAPAQMVKVVFNVSLPPSEYASLPVRLAGDLYQVRKMVGARRPRTDA